MKSIVEMYLYSQPFLLRASNNIFAFIADVGLTGELKKVPSIEIRVKELARMGFKKVYVAKDSFNKEVKIPNIKIMSMKTLNDVIADVYK